MANANDAARVSIECKAGHSTLWALLRALRLGDTKVVDAIRFRLLAGALPAGLRFVETRRRGVIFCEDVFCGVVGL